MSISTRAPDHSEDDDKGRPPGRPLSNQHEPDSSPSATPPNAGADAHPRLAQGIDLIGEYEGSGFKKPHFIARRADGQVIQLSELLYLVADSVDGASSSAQIAERVSARYEKSVSASNVEYLIEKKLRPLGILANADGSSPELERADPMLALKFRFKLVPESLVTPITWIFRPFFWPPFVVAVLAAMAVLDVWLFFVHGVAQSMRGVVYQPALLLLIFGLVVISAAFHEIGHATACAYGGGKPGAIGAGLYLVWPAFYTDVTDAYRLGKWGRLRTDLGGVYFNLIFSLLTAAVYFATGFEPLLLVIVLQHLEIAHQFLPFLRLDGYYIISDLTGIPDMFARLRPILRSLLPWRKTEPSVKELKPWARFSVTTWVLLTVPFVAFNIGVILVHSPRIFATAWDSLYVHTDKMGAAFAKGDGVAGAASIVQMMALVLPSAGIVLSFGRLGKRISEAAWSWSQGKPLARGAAVMTGVALVGAIAYIWIPNGDYVPIQPEEKGTLSEGVQAFSYLGTGRPSFPTQKERSLGELRYENSFTAPSTSEQDGPSEISPASDPAPLPSPTQSPAEPSPVPSPETSASPTTTPEPSPSL